MWNGIRQPPFIGTDSSGRRVGFIYPSFQQQFRVESWLIALMYMATTVVILALTHFVPLLNINSGEVGESKDEEETGSEGPMKTTLIVTCLFAWILFMSILSLAFRLKGTGYPFGFFF